MRVHTTQSQVFADLEPLSGSKVAVQFKTFKIFGFIPVQAPPSARGEFALSGQTVAPVGTAALTPVMFCVLLYAV